MTDTYTLHIVQVECIEAQETDGDELYITLDDRMIWQARPFTLHHHPSTDRQLKAVHFAGSRRLTRDGWISETDTPVQQLVIPDLSGTHTLRLWDHDVLTSDDLLGENPVALTDAGRGTIQVVFTRDGARYHLSYRVETG
ncbi:MAG: hypothetical protein SF162_13955 [bacterium]|nr:hypothetical protein [bacterium]